MQPLVEVYLVMVAFYECTGAVVLLLHGKLSSGGDRPIVGSTVPGMVYIYHSR